MQNVFILKQIRFGILGALHCSSPVSGEVRRGKGNVQAINNGTQYYFLRIDSVLTEALLCLPLASS
jgi:hypothetical protein